MKFDISEHVQVEIEDKECTITWCDFDKGQVGHIVVDGSPEALVTKCNREGKTTSIKVDMLSENMMVKSLKGEILK